MSEIQNPAAAIRSLTDGASASGGQRSSFRPPFVFQMLERWRCFILTSSHRSFEIFDFLVRLGGESGAGGGSGFGLLSMI